MVIVTRGSVKLVGNKTGVLNEGDLVAIPRNCKHGFIGDGVDGFWGLSIQFEHRGLYEDITNPLVEFVNHTDQTGFDKLILDNQFYVEEFDKNFLFDMMRSGKFHSPIVRDRFFDCFQVFSNYFQKMMMNRVCFTDNDLYLPLFELHLEEEFGHNTRLKEDRRKRKAAWDPILEATSSWFANKMLSLDNLEKIVLVHLVVETSACTFYRNAKNIMEVDSFQSKHFDIHLSDIDLTHAKLGIDFLKNTHRADFDNLSALQKQGWKMLNAAFNRIAELL